MFFKNTVLVFHSSLGIVMTVQAGTVKVTKPDLWFTFARKFREIAKGRIFYLDKALFPGTGGLFSPYYYDWILLHDGQYYIEIDFESPGFGQLVVHFRLKKRDANGEQVIKEVSTDTLPANYATAYAWIALPIDIGYRVRYYSLQNNRYETVTGGPQPPSSLDWWYNWKREYSYGPYEQTFDYGGYLYNNVVYGVLQERGEPGVSGSSTLRGNPAELYFKCDEGWCYNVNCIEGPFGKKCLPSYIADYTEWPEPPTSGATSYNGAAKYPEPTPCVPGPDGYTVCNDNGYLIAIYGGSQLVYLVFSGGRWYLGGSDGDSIYRLEYEGGVGPGPPVYPDGALIGTDYKYKVYVFESLELVDYFIVPPPTSSRTKVREVAQ